MLGGLLFRLKNKVPVPETLDLHDWSRVILHSPQTKQSRVCLSKSLIILPVYLLSRHVFAFSKRNIFLALIPKCQITRAFSNGGGAFLRFGSNLNGNMPRELMIFCENFKWRALENGTCSSSF